MSSCVSCPLPCYNLREDPVCPLSSVLWFYNVPMPEQTSSESPMVLSLHYYYWKNINNCTADQIRPIQLFDSQIITKGEKKLGNLSPNVTKNAEQKATFYLLSSCYQWVLWTQFAMVKHHSACPKIKNNVKFKDAQLVIRYSSQSRVKIQLVKDANQLKTYCFYHKWLFLCNK